MTKNQPNNAQVVDSCTTRLAALKRYGSPATTIAIAGKTLALADVIAIYQHCLDTRDALAMLRAQVKAEMVLRASAEAGRRAADRALKPWVINQFGADSQQAHDFGFPPAKVPKRTAEAKAHAVALGHATRAARHTMGSKQKEHVKGTVPAPPAPADPATHPAGGAAPPAATTPAPVATPANGVPAPGGSNGVPTHA